jgi:hypothetical protein
MASQTVLSVLQNNDANVELDVTEDDGSTPQDLTGLIVAMFIKASDSAPDSTATVLTSGSGLTITNVTGGEVTAFLAEAMLAIAATLWWRLDVTDGAGHRTTVMYGQLLVNPV